MTMTVSSPRSESRSAAGAITVVALAYNGPGGFFHHRLLMPLVPGAWTGSSQEALGDEHAA